MAHGLISIQVSDVDLADRGKIEKFCNSIAPVMVQEISNALSGPKSKGCSVSGTVTGGPGGISGSGTITCTF